MSKKENAEAGEKRKRSSEAESATKPPEPCGRTRGELDELKAKCNIPGSGFLTGDYFFNASEPELNKHTAALVKKFYIAADDMDHRCRKCGHTIDEHKSAIEQVARKVDIEEVMRKLQALVDADTGTPYLPNDLQNCRVEGSCIEFDEEVTQHINAIFKEPVLMVKQKSKAMVLVGASGTGKTFAALTYPKQKSPTRANLTAYIGFNTGLGLSSKETSLIEEPNEHDRREKPIQKVVLCRTVVVILYMTKHHLHLQPLNGDAHPIMKIDLQAEAYKQLLMCDIDDIKREAVECIAKLADTQKSKSDVALLLNLDEAQYFDRYSDKGARFALRMLRELQLLVFARTDRKCVVMPLATGINPYTTLTEETDGNNVPTTATLLTKDQFQRLAQQKYPNYKKIPQFSLFVAASYPRVRRMLSTSEDKLELQDVTLPLAADYSSIVSSAIEHSKLDRAKIPTMIATENAAQKTVPILDMAVWSSLVSETVPSARLPLSVPCSFARLESDCYSFEVLAFNVVGFTMEFFWSPDPMMDKPFDRFIVVNSVLREWCGEGRFVAQSRTSLQDATLHTHPFEQPNKGKGNSTEIACRGSLSDEFKSAIRRLRANSGVLLRCGASAAIDFLLVRIAADGKTCIISYADAKHSQGKKERDQSTNYGNEMIDKAQKVHDGLTRELTMLGYVVKKEHKTMVITNALVTQPTNGLLVLGPSSFHFFPWADVLFGRR